MVAQLFHREEGGKEERPLKRRVGYDAETETKKSQVEDEDDGTSRPIIRCRYGYSKEIVNEATKRMSDMEIDNIGGASKGQDCD